MENCKPVSTPMTVGLKLSKDDGAAQADGRIYRSLIGSLLYLTATRPDIVFTVNYLSRFMQNPSQIHFVAAKRVLRYLKGTLDFDMNFVRSNITNLTSFSDNDWARSDKEMSSALELCFSIGGTIFSWNSKKQTMVAHSTTEAKYIVAHVTANHLIWLRKILGELSFKQAKPIELWCDNMTIIAISKKIIFHNRTKHMKIKFHVIRQFQQEGDCSTNEQLDDLFTKSLAKERFEDLREKVGMWSPATLEPGRSVED